MRRNMLIDRMSLCGSAEVFRILVIFAFVELEGGKGQRRHELGSPLWVPVILVGRVGEVAEEIDDGVCLPEKAHRLGGDGGPASAWGELVGCLVHVHFGGEVD